MALYISAFLPNMKVELNPREVEKSGKKQLNMSSIIAISNENETAPKQKKKNRFPFLYKVSSLVEKQCVLDMRKVIHSVKVGIALVIVSLLYLLDPLFEQVGENAMWAIMTVVVIFEFFAGATLSKGLNRGIGTILGGGMGCLVAIFADEWGRIGNAIFVGTSVFIFGGVATYCRLIPSIKKRHDYGVLIFILTFNLVAVSGLRADKVMELARERLSTISMGFAVCIFISLLIFPMWASDELHCLTSSKFDKLAGSIEECLEEYFREVSEKKRWSSGKVNSCKSVLHSKSSDESLVISLIPAKLILAGKAFGSFVIRSEILKTALGSKGFELPKSSLLLANFARWEPWHGKFGFYHPWEKYLQVGEMLRELAAIILSVQGCLESPMQPSATLRQVIKEPCEIVGLSLGGAMRELGESIMKRKRCPAKVAIVPKLQSMKLELSLVSSSSRLRTIENVEALVIANFLFLLIGMVEKVEALAKDVEELGESAGFQTK